MSNDTPSVVATPVKSSWFSKINWTNALALLAGILTFFGFDVPPELEAQILLLIGAASQVITIVMRMLEGRASRGLARGRTV